jgi:hypothetical protein
MFLLVLFPKFLGTYETGVYTMLSSPFETLLKKFLALFLLLFNPLRSSNILLYILVVSLVASVKSSGDRIDFFFLLKYSC